MVVSFGFLSCGFLEREGEPKPGGALMPDRFRLNPARRVVMWIKSLPFLILINDVFIPTPVGRRTILTSHLPLCP